MTWGEEMLAQGFREGERAILQKVVPKLLQQRFGPLPAAVIEKIKQAPTQRLEEWSVRLLDARSLDETLAE